MITSNLKLTAFVVKENAGELLKLNELVAAGSVAPVLGSALPLSDGAASLKWAPPGGLSNGAAARRGDGPKRIALGDGGTVADHGHDPRSGGI